MPITPFPGGLSSFGAPVAPGVQGAIDRYWAGGTITWVCNRSGMPSGDGSSPSNPLSSLVGTGGALAALQGLTNQGSIIFVLPGHAESVSAADWAVLTGAASGFAIVGLGTGTSRPAFTWSTATSTWLIDTANVAIDNVRMFMAGDPALTAALTVAAPITVSAAGFTLRNCTIQMGVDADQLVTNGITTTAAGDDMLIDNCYMWSPVLAEATSFLKLVGADRFKMINSVLTGATSSTTSGSILFATTASTNIYIDHCVIENLKAISVDAVTGLASCTGIVRDTDMTIIDTATLTGWSTPASVNFFNCFVVNVLGENGGVKTVVSN